MVSTCTGAVSETRRYASTVLALKHLSIRIYAAKNLKYCKNANDGMSKLPQRCVSTSTMLKLSPILRLYLLVS